MNILYHHRTAGDRVELTLEGDILIDLVVESSSRGTDVNIAGTLDVRSIGASAGAAGSGSAGSRRRSPPSRQRPRPS